MERLSSTSHVSRDTDINKNCPTSNSSVFQIHKLEAMFALKLMAKHMLSQEVVNDIINFSNNIHSSKINVIKTALKRQNVSEDMTNLCEQIDRIEAISGLNDKISTHYKRLQYLKKRFDFVEPRKIEIGRKRGKVCFYMSLPVTETLSRMLSDKSLRRYIINNLVLPTKESAQFD